jgi:hypothetical protein
LGGSDRFKKQTKNSKSWLALGVSRALIGFKTNSKLGLGWVVEYRLLIGQNLAWVGLGLFGGLLIGQKIAYKI